MTSYDTPGSITLTADLLNFAPEPVNILLALPIDGETVGKIFNHDADLYIENKLEDAGLEYSDLDIGAFWIDADYQAMTQEYVKLVADGNAPEQFAELFTADGDTPPILTITDVRNDMHGDGWGRDIMTATLAVDGERLLALAHKYGVTEVHDGHGISGFIRTADDNFWCVIQTVEEVLKAMAQGCHVSDNPWWLFHDHAWELSSMGYLDLMDYAAESDLNELDAAIQSALDARAS